MPDATGDPPTPEATSLLLMSEDLRIERVRVDGERVVVGTATRDVEHAVDEALVHERVEVERVAIGLPVSAVPEVREEGDVTVFPVVEEVLVIERRLVPSKPIEPSMTEETIVAIYDTAAHAEAAIRDLKAGNIPDSAISRHASAGSTTGGTATPTNEKGFWASLFGEEHGSHGEVYGRSVESGSTVVSVKVASEHYDHVAAILEKHDPVDVEERTSQYGLTGSSAATYAGVGMANHGGKAEPARSATEANAIDESGLSARDFDTTGTRATTGVEADDGEGVMKLAAESLNVGKRAVQGGTTRIRRFTVSKPVEDNVTLHSEKVVLDRRPVTDGKVLTDADFNESISMTESHEEAVVSKTARVVEEIGLHKEASDRVETVRDTLRHEEIEVEQVPVERGETARTTPGERKI